MLLRRVIRLPLPFLPRRPAQPPRTGTRTVRGARPAQPGGASLRSLRTAGRPGPPVAGAHGTRRRAELACVLLGLRFPLQTALILSAAPTHPRARGVVQRQLGQRAPGRSCRPLCQPHGVFSGTQGGPSTETEAGWRLRPKSRPFKSAFPRSPDAGPPRPKSGEEGPGPPSRPELAPPAPAPAPARESPSPRGGCSWRQSVPH